MALLSFVESAPRPIGLRRATPLRFFNIRRDIGEIVPERPLYDHLIDERRASGFDCLRDAGDLVDRQMIHEHDLAALEGRDKTLPDIGEEALR
jgi:hypothetical protein